MNIVSLASNVAKKIFTNKASAIGVLSGAGIAGTGIYNTLNSLNEKKDDKEIKKDLALAYTGFATIAGSIFGVGGSIVAGASVYALSKYNEDKF